MPNTTPPAARPLPPFLRYAATAVIVFHLIAIGVLALAAPSGPWPTNFGSSMAMEPFFVTKLRGLFMRSHWQPLRMSHNYHFVTSRPLMPAITFEVKLYDKAGKFLKTVKAPSESSNPWIRFREQQLANGLGGDEPVAPPQSEQIAAPGKKAPTIRIWDSADAASGALQLKLIEQHLAPRDRPVFQPNEWALMLAKAYVRAMCEEHDAASGELIRRSREPVSPVVLIAPPPPGSFNELVCSFGKVNR